MEKNGEIGTLVNSTQRSSSPTTSSMILYVGNLDASVTEIELTNAFGSYGTIESVHLVCKGDPPSIHGYVSFVNEKQALDAIDGMNDTVLKGKPIRVMKADKDLVQTKVSRNSANVYVKNLDESVDRKLLEKMFSVFGTVVSCKVAMENGLSKGYGFVQFSNKEEADASIIAFSSSTSDCNNGKKLYVAKYMNKIERLNRLQGATCNNLYIKNFDEDLTDDQLREKFSPFGVVKNAIVMKDESGKSRGFGFVCFQSPEDARKAIQVMNGTKQGSKILYVGKAQRKNDRERLLKCKFQDKEKFQSTSVLDGKGSNIFLLNIDGSITEESLTDIFYGIGQVRSLSSLKDFKALTLTDEFNFSKYIAREIALLDKKVFPIPSHKSISEWVRIPHRRINSNTHQKVLPCLKSKADFHHAQMTFANDNKSTNGNKVKSYNTISEALSSPYLSYLKNEKS